MDHIKVETRYHLARCYRLSGVSVENAIVNITKIER